MSEFLKVKEWKEKNQPQFILQYCPDTFVKRAKRIKDGEIFRTFDKVWAPVIGDATLLDFSDNNVTVIISIIPNTGTVYSVKINDISIMLKANDEDVIKRYSQLKY